VERCCQPHVASHASGSLRTHVHSAGPGVRKANLIARRSTGKVGYVEKVKCALGYRIPPEDDEIDELAREKAGSPS
jgi:hypothetical protein